MITIPILVTCDAPGCSCSIEFRAACTLTKRYGNEVGHYEFEARLPPALRGWEVDDTTGAARCPEHR
jgi:hypothetical protein